MLRSWKLGRAFGIEFFMHWTFLLLPLYVLVAVAPARGFASALFAVSVLLAVFGCVVLHELGHALMARWFGISTKDITLYPIGGIARLERMSERPWEEFWIAVAGPAVNVAIVLLLVVFFSFTQPDLSEPRRQALEQLTPALFDYPLGEQLLLLLLPINKFLFLFNMLPVFPMDGGRVLRAVLAAFMPHVRATAIAVFVGIPLAGLFALAGLGVFQPYFPATPILVLIALFVMFAGQQELLMLRYKAARGRVALVESRPLFEAQTLDASALPPLPNYSGFTWDQRAGAWIEWRQGQPVQAYFVEHG